MEYRNTPQGLAVTHKACSPMASAWQIRFELDGSTSDAPPRLVLKALRDDETAWVCKALQFVCTAPRGSYAVYRQGSLVTDVNARQKVQASVTIGPIPLSMSHSLRRWTCGIAVDLPA